MTQTLANLQQKRAERRRNKQRGITLLEILIVLAIIGLVMALLVGPAVMRAFGSSKTKVARIAVRKFAYEAYPQWSAQHTGKRCPESLKDLTPFMNSDDTKDPWGNEYVMQCGDQAPAGSKGFAVISYGEDGKPGGSGDAADINSWQVDEDQQ
jgi:general secretion pathway protein G